MVPVLKTKRLTQRPLSLDDQDAMVRTIMADTEVMKWLPCSDQVSTHEGQCAVAVSFITDFVKPWNDCGFGVWALCIRNAVLRSPGDLIGYCGFLPEQIQDAGPEIAYAVGRSMWGKGLATEAVATCLEWIFTQRGIHRVHAVTDKPNAASQKVMEKTGMTYERDVDLYDSVAKGNGLLKLYSLDREAYLASRI